MVDLDSLAPMLLDERPLNLEEPGWIQELKYDVSFVKKLSKSRSSPTGLDCAIPHRILKACRLADLERHCAHSAVRNCKLSTVQLSLLRAWTYTTERGRDHFTGFASEWPYVLAAAALAIKVIWLGPRGFSE